MITKVIAANTLYQVITRIITSGIGFLITIIIARNLGVLGYGDFTKITAYVGLLYLIVDFGLNAFYLQEGKRNERFFSLLSFRLILGFFLAIFISLFILLLPFTQTVKIGVFIFSFSILNQAILLSTSAIFQQKLNYKHLLVATIIGSLSSLVFVYLSAYLSLGIFYILAGLVLGGFITNVISLLFIKNVLQPIIFDKEFVLKLLKISAPYGIMLLFNLVYFRIDTILLSLMRPTEEVGIYGFSYKFFDFLIALPLFLSNALYPSLLTWQKNHRTLLYQVKKLIFPFIILSFMILILSWILAPLIGYVKNDFIPSIFSFRILILSLPFFFLTNLFQWILVILRKQNFLFVVYFFAAIINIILNVIFIPIYGYMASAIITGISEGIVLLLLAFKILQIQKFSQT